MRLFAFLSVIGLSVMADELQVDPNGVFSIVIPGPLLPCSLTPGNLACPADASVLTISTQKTTSPASVQLMALNAEDSIRDKPSFKLVNKETISIDGNKAVVQTMTFNNLSNVTLPVVVRVLDAALGTTTFELQAACNQSTCDELFGAFDSAIKSLHLAAPGQKLLKSKASGGFGNFFGSLDIKPPLTVGAK